MLLAVGSLVLRRPPTMRVEQGHSTLVGHDIEAGAAAALLFLPHRSPGLSAVAASPWAAAAGAACCRAPPRERGPPRAWRARCPA